MSKRGPKANQAKIQPASNSKLQSMNKLRARRKADGFVQRTHMIPLECAEEFKQFAEEL